MKNYRWAQGETVEDGIRRIPPYGWQVDLYLTSPIWANKKKLGFRIAPLADFVMFRGPVKGRWGFYSSLSVPFVTISLKWAKRMPNDVEPLSAKQLAYASYLFDKR